MTEIKINKTCHCAGRLRASIQLKCTNKFTMEQVLLTNHEAPAPKFFEVASISNVAIKCSPKVKKSQLYPGDFEGEKCRALYFRQERRTPTPYQLSPTFPTVYSLQTHVTHRATNKKPATQERLTPIHLLTRIWWKKRVRKERLTPIHPVTS